MPLRLITGPSNSGKTGEVIKVALSAAAEGASPVLAVPNLADVRRLETELAGKAPLGVRVVTLGQLALDLWMLHGDGRRIVGGATRTAVIRRLLGHRLEPELGVAAGTPGLERLVARLAQGSSSEGSLEGGLGGAEAAMGSLMQRYRAALAADGLIERNWLGELLGGVSPAMGGPLGVMRFDRYTAAELRLLLGCAGSNDVTVALTWASGFAPTRANDAAAGVLGAAAVEHIALIETPANQEIQALAQALYVGPAGLQSHGAVVVGTASGGEAEDALIARLAASELAAGVAAERIVIAHPHAGGRAPGIETALLSRGVSADLDVVWPFESTQFGRAWSSLLALALGRGGRAEALGFIASPFSGASPEAVQRADRQWRQNRTSDPVTLLRDTSKLETSTRQAVALARRVARGRLSVAALCDWQELADILLDSALRSAQGGILARREARDASAHQALVRSLAEMARGTTEPLDAGDVLSSCSSISVRENVGETPGRVQVCDFDRVGARRFDVVILAGLTESELPVAESDSFQQQMRSAFSRQVEGDDADRTRLQFYSLISRARRRLYLVRQEADSEGRAMRASALLEDTVDAYRPVGASPESMTGELLPSQRVVRSDLVELAPALTSARREARSAAAGIRLLEIDRGVVRGSEGLAALANTTVFSATEVETYLECPYRWFYERVVRPKEIDRALDARELGTRAHSLIAAFYRRICELSEHKRVTPEWLGEALALFEEVAGAERDGAIAAGGLPEELAAARAVSWARNVVGEDARFLPGFVPELAELPFGDEERRFSFAGHYFLGRIDRIDASPASVFVTDYKTSLKVPGLAKFESDAKIQAVFYACAAQDLLGLPISGSVYRSMRSGELRGFWRRDLFAEMPQGMCQEDGLDEDGFAALVGRTEQRVSAAIDGMRSGDVRREPAVKGACTYCPIAAFCEGARR